MKIALLVPLALLLATCSRPPEGAKTREAILDEVAGIPWRHASNLGGFRKDDDWKLRVRVVPPLLLAHLMEVDERWDYGAWTPNEKEIEQTVEAIEKLPESWKRILREKLAAIYFVHNWWGGGGTEWILDDAGRPVYFIALNPATLRVDLADWLAWKERSTFAADGRSKIHVSTPSGHKGLAYILSHEAAHVIDYEQGLTPAAEPEYAALWGRTATVTRFTEGVWTGHRLVAQGKVPTGRSNLSIYGFKGKPKFAAKDAEAFYRSLSSSPFPSPYALSSWSEDFADCAAFRILSRSYGVNPEVRILKDDETIFSYHPADAAFRREIPEPFAP